MKVLSVLLLAAGVVLLGLTALALNKGALSFTCFAFTFVVLPRYSLVTAVVFLLSGFATIFVPHP
jgi:hypothetical protein